MSRPPSVLVTRTVPSLDELGKLYRKERNADNVRRLHAIILMLKFQNAEDVADMCLVGADTLRRWIKAFNEEGLGGLFKKNNPAARPS
jgi:transposase